MTTSSAPSDRPLPSGSFGCRSSVKRSIVNDQGFADEVLSWEHYTEGT
ncbi:MAG: hypothetical protein AAGH78_08120 [Cyanobacteria bacterium P01_H01_bin.58]